MIYFISPPPAEPSGGVWFIHRLAAMLDGSGHPARVWMALPQGRGVWWDISPIDPHLVIDARPLNLEAADTLIVPEFLYHELGPMPIWARGFVFLQNHIWLNREYFKEHPTSVIVCSRYLYNWCTRELGVTPAGIVRPGLNPLLWRPTPKQSNRTLILARRNVEMARLLASTLEADGFPIDFVDEELSQWQLFEHLANAEYYVHHVEPEGFPMMALEAMRSGVIVVGTTGGGGNEFMHNDETALVTPGPLMGLYPDTPGLFVEKVALRLRRLRDDADLRSKLWTQAYEWSKRYTSESTLAEITSALDLEPK